MQVALSPDAVAVLRFEIKGYRSKVPGSQLPAYRELAAAGIMEPVPGSDTEYRFTEYGMKHREEIVEREAERIERDRYEPPDANLSEAVRERLRLHLAGDCEMTEENPGMMARRSHDQIMQVFEVLGIASQNRNALGDTKDQHSRIRDGQQSDVRSKDRIVTASPKPRGQARIAHVLVEQRLHSCAGPRRPRARSLAASWSRSCWMSGRFWAT